ncbi:MAG TPA: phenylalanine--tRNA ligase subunit beta, partial [Candidatus Omnitrophota bacterium]|nr:phenylalanine--tRNA ligase subunit beta [Candidatus Omnitrophota bacterium]
MKLSYNWLKDYVNVKASPEELARILTMSGSKVEGIAKVGDDHVLELEITANRPDCLNIIGLARELSAVLGEELKLPEQNIGKSMPDDKNSVRIECIVEAPELCPQYTARIITGVKVKKSSAKIAARIMALGMREINNVADITNYCLHELGQPMHAFDLDKIKGGKIIVREARDGEKIVTIDGVERELKKGMLVIADVERPVAIAGIMGGIDTEVSEKTKNVLLESAYFNLLSIRRTGRKLVLSTDASYRYERGVDRGMIIPASERAAAMIMGEAGGNVGGFYNVGDCRSKKMSIDFDPNKINTTLGIDIDKKEVKGILVRLGMEVSDKTDGRFTVGVPSFREDIKLRVDLMEEIARIYGYENIPARIPEISPAVIRKEKPRQVKEKITEVLVSLGMNEIMTYS